FLKKVVIGSRSM
ncbi:hypothetical protein D046_6023B, partial [Vibrio parahaemolyticus V-223/04]